MSGSNAAGPSVLHATLIARRFSEGWRGALLRGPSGAGKSDLALRAMAQGFRLVADDRVLVWTSGGRAWGRAPATLRGLVENRHLGVAVYAALPLATVALVVDLTASSPERMPAPRVCEVAGVAVARAELRAFEAGTPGRIAALLDSSARAGGSRPRAASLP